MSSDLTQRMEDFILKKTEEALKSKGINIPVSDYSLDFIKLSLFSEADQNLIRIAIDIARDRLEDSKPDTLNKFVKIKGKSFRCEKCNSNMFTEVGSRKGLEENEIRYRCQGCDAEYIGT